MRAFLCLFAVAARGTFGQFFSVVQSSSWKRGQDGELHQEVHSVRDNVARMNGIEKRTMTSTDCVDGNCVEANEVKFLAPHSVKMPSLHAFGWIKQRWFDREPDQASPDIEMPSPRAFEWPHETPSGLALRGMLRGMMGPRIQLAQPEVVVITDVHKPLEYKQLQPYSHQPAAMAHVSTKPATFLGQVDNVQGDRLALNLVAVMLAGASLVCAIVTAMRVLCFSPASARELRDLVEPFAAAGPVAVAVEKVVVEPQVKASILPQTTSSESETKQTFELKPSVGTWLCQTPCVP